MKQASYESIRPEIKPGDIMAFSGKGLISSIIKLTTNSPVTHVGMVLTNSIMGDTSLVMLAESTSLGSGFSGVRFTRMSDHLRDYDDDIWWLPLKKEVRENLNEVDLVNFLLSQKGKKYDTPQAIASAIDGDYTRESDEDLSKLFCSEYSTAALEVGFQNHFRSGDVMDCLKRLNGINSSEQTPADMVAFDIYSRIYQIKGDEKEI